MKERLQINLTVTKTGAKSFIKNKRSLKFLHLKFSDNKNIIQRRPNSFNILIQEAGVPKKLLDFNIHQEIQLKSNIKISKSFYIIVKPKQQYKRFTSFQISVWFDVI